MRSILAGLAGIFIAASVALPAHADASLWRKLHEPGHFAIMRHAEAPGYGDPDNFRLDDCSTQRNLDDKGRAQARAIGDQARANGVAEARLFSSQWCRCKETARLLGFGDPAELPALNSLFGRAEQREPNMRALKSFLAEQPAAGAPLVLVSHQVTINALAGQSTRSGEVVVLRHKGAGAVEVVGSIPPG